MNSSKFRIYLAFSDNRYRVGMARNLLLELKLLGEEGYGRIISLSYPLPAGVGYYVLHKIATLEEREGRLLPGAPAGSRLMGRGGFPLPLRFFRWGRGSIGDVQNSFLRWIEGRLLDGVKRTLSAFDYPTRFAAEEASLADCEGLLLPDPREVEALRDILGGKILFSDEIERRFKKVRGFRTPFEDLLQVLIHNGECIMLPGVEVRGFGQLFCNRCGETERFHEGDCFKCGNPHCYRCEECNSMGESSLCSALYALKEPPAKHDGPSETGGKSKSLEGEGEGAGISPSHPTDILLLDGGCGGSSGGAEIRGDNPRWQKGKPIRMELTFPLTPAQERAAEGVRAFLREAAPAEEGCLVWAVCGAGKTEVAFGAVEETLNKGGRVLFAIPRRDVVRELEPRIRKVFPTVRVGALYGGAPERDESAEVIIATTHQCIRFFHAFDLVILDEADAYPYRGSRMLYFALERARKEGGKVIYMTATPGRDLKAHVASGRLRAITIPARHHGHPLPVPIIVKEKLTRRRGKGGEGYRIPPRILNFLVKSAINDIQVFLFVPTIEQAERAGKALKEYFRRNGMKGTWSEWVEYSHSQDPQRAQKCREFSEGCFPIFVTTTILERGITVRRANVVVLFADDNFVFDEGSLIQMAGRSGRSVEYPKGEVLFVGEKVTKEMESAIRNIEWMNEEARRLGYLNI